MVQFSKQNSMRNEDFYKVIPYLAHKIKFIHFRNVIGNKYKFREIFHNDGFGVVLNY